MKNVLLAKKIGALVLLFTAAAGAQASIVYTTTLSGVAENPSNTSPGTGVATVEFDPVGHTLQLDVSFSGLSGTTTAAHIHCCVAPPSNAGVAIGASGFAAGVSNGSYSHLFDLTSAASYNSAFVTNSGGTAAAAEAALAAALANGQAYFNIHTSAFGGGEIRGFFAPAAVPVPAAVWLFGSGMLGLLGMARSRRPVGC